MNPIYTNFLSNLVNTSRTLKSLIILRPGIFFLKIDSGLINKKMKSFCQIYQNVPGLPFKKKMIMYIARREINKDDPFKIFRIKEHVNVIQDFLDGRICSLRDYRENEIYNLYIFIMKHKITSPNSRIERYIEQTILLCMSEFYDYFLDDLKALCFMYFPRQVNEYSNINDIRVDLGNGIERIYLYNDTLEVLTRDNLWKTYRKGRVYDIILEYRNKHAGKSIIGNRIIQTRSIWNFVISCDHLWDPKKKCYSTPVPGLFKDLYYKGLFPVNWTIQDYEEIIKLIR